MKQLANLITFSRLVFSLVLLFLKPFTTEFYVVYSYCGLSDMADGLIASKTNGVSNLGSVLDSLADFTFLIIVLVKVIRTVNFPLYSLIWIALIFLIRVSNICFGYYYQKKFVMLHTSANKVTGFILFLIPLLLNLGILDYLIIISCLVATFASVQEGHYIRCGVKE
jgi:phosphatidylglycerophosphate synthase